MIMREKEPLNLEMPFGALDGFVTPNERFYIRCHFLIPKINERDWRLRVGGKVARPFEVTMDDLRQMPTQTITATLECAGNSRVFLVPKVKGVQWELGAVGNAEWTGVRLRELLQRAEMANNAREIILEGADNGTIAEPPRPPGKINFARSLPVEKAMDDVLLAFAMNGEPLQPQHGFPLRLLVPGWYGMTSVKWLSSIEAIAEPFQGYQQTPAYHYQRDADDPGQPVTRIRVRALMVPPGIPDFFSRRRFLDAGPIQVGGRAWSGAGPVARVEVAVDGHWSDAKLGPPLGDFAWRSWSFDWQATPGEHELACRATDAAGNVQPSEQPWNYQGVGNNLIQQVAVAVR